MKHESFVKELTDILVQHKKITAREAHAMQESFARSNKENFDDFLLDEGLVEREDLLEALGQLYQVPSFDTVGYFFDHQLVLMFPEQFLMTHAIIPIEVEDNIMLICASNPADSDLLPAIGEYVSYDIQFNVGIANDIMDAIEEFYDPALQEDNNDEELISERTLRSGERQQEEEIEELVYENFDRD